MEQMVRDAPQRYKNTPALAAMKWLDKHIDVPLNKNQFATLVSFLITVSLRDSTLSAIMVWLNQHEFTEAWDEISLFTVANGREVDYLRGRRELEEELFFTECEPDITLVVNR